MNSRHVLAAIFSASLLGTAPDARTLGQRLHLSRSEAEHELSVLDERGLVRTEGGRARLTEKGRKSIKVVFIGGGFEVIHYGHVYTIEKAKGLGDALVVSVARDSTIRKRKGREPIVSEKDRVRLLSALRSVDAAILGVEGDIYVTLQKVSPDVVALGYDQYHMEGDIKSEAARRGLKVNVVRLDSPYPEIKTSRLLREF
ncbi:MAG: FAD synthase [Nitrososphaerota archaeon]|nr:FAD synthase [Nitrososphaerota archaeon]